jgi:glyoxylase I family protein
MLLEMFSFAASRPRPKHTDALETDLPVIGIKHFALQVSSLSNARTYLDKHGISCTESKQGRTGIDYFFAQDPDGNWLEIVQDDRLSRDK